MLSFILLMAAVKKLTAKNKHYDVGLIYVYKVLMFFHFLFYFRLPLFLIFFIFENGIKNI